MWVWPTATTSTGLSVPQYTREASCALACATPSLKAAL